MSTRNREIACTDGIRMTWTPERSMSTRDSSFMYKPLGGRKLTTMNGVKGKMTFRAATKTWCYVLHYHRVKNGKKLNK